MCGILAAISREEGVGDAILRGLRRLEYRGYDSAGIALLAPGGELVVRRASGPLGNLEGRVQADGFPAGARVGLGHTRWATHGAPVEGNAHPHRDCKGDLVVAHNGIIENYLELRRELEGQGHAFASETDTEVIAHLVEAAFAAPPPGPPGASRLARAVHAAVARLKGSYALVVLSRREPDRLVAAREDSPLVAGISNGLVFLASDVPAFLERTRDVLYLENGEIVEAAPGEVRVRRADGVEVRRAPVRVDWSAEAAERGGYPHFMLKEIHEQPDVVARCAFERLDEARGDVRFEDPFLADDARLAAFDRVRIVACGTALHAGLVGRAYLERIAGLPAEVDYASEFRYRAAPSDGKVLAVAVSQSGETADTVGAAREARRGGAAVLAIVNVAGSSLHRESDAALLTHAGPEIGVASTKAFVAQLVALYLLALRLGRARGTLSAEAARGRLARLRALRSHLAATLASDATARLRDLAGSCRDARGFLFLGRGLLYPIALEGALKMKEISYVHAEGYPAGEMKHGPIALVEPALPCVGLLASAERPEKLASNLEEVRARGGRLVVVTTRGEGPTAGADRIEVPAVDPEFAPIVDVVPLQLLAYEVACARGCDVDRPRNLAKSVTVE